MFFRGFSLWPMTKKDWLVYWHTKLDMSLLVSLTKRPQLVNEKKKKKKDWRTNEIQSIHHQSAARILISSNFLISLLWLVFISPWIWNSVLFCRHIYDWFRSNWIELNFGDWTIQGTQRSSCRSGRCCWLWVPWGQFCLVLGCQSWCRSCSSLCPTRANTKQKQITLGTNSH